MINSRRFGIEIELNGDIGKKQVCEYLGHLNKKIKLTHYQLSDGNCWHVKDDMTCGDKKKGVEIASPILNGKEGLEEAINVADHLFKSGCRSGDNCGLHIHAEAIDLIERDVATILAYWIKTECVVSYALPERRLNNPFCRFTYENYHNEVLDRSRRWPASVIWDTLKPRKFSLAENEDRKVNLNIVNYLRAIKNNTDKRKTLEFRWPEGSLDKNDIKNWSIFFLNFIDICKKLHMPSNLNPFNLEEFLSFINLDEEFKLWFSDRIKLFSSNRK